MANKKEPINWWRVAALAAVPLFLHTTWQYAEAQARYSHLLDHVKTTHGRVPHADEEHPPAQPSAPEPRH